MANQPDNNDKPGIPRPKNPTTYWIYLVMAGAMLAFFFLGDMQQGREVSWPELRDYLTYGDIEKVEVINEDVAEIYIKKEALEEARHDEAAKPMFSPTGKAGPHYNYKIGTLEKFENDFLDAQATTAESDRIYLEFDERINWLAQSLGWLLPLGLIVLVWVFLMRRMGQGGGAGSQMFNFGKSRAKVFDSTNEIKVSFKDVAGHEEAKAEVREIVDFLKHPEKYTRLGAKIPKGVILAGPPGTGKTLLAKAVAGEAGVPFFSLSGSEFVEMFVGVGASRVRDLFKKAKEKSPSIIFIDEIDAIGRSRGKAAAFSGNDERENTLNQLLAEMDGFGTNTGVIVLAATNRANILDRALLRPGRFDRHIFLDLPNLREREAIFGVHLRPLTKAEELNVEQLAMQTPGFSGADIHNVCNEAALIAARKNRDAVGAQDFMEAIDRIVAGLERRSKVISPDEKKTIAWHEAGHALTSWMYKHAHPLVKVTIIPRGRALGAAWYMPEERQITTTAQFFDEMCVMLAGRAAEELVFDEISSGALDDLERTTKQAYSMVSVYGLNEKVGNISYYDSSGQNENSFQKPYSEETARMIDQEVRALVEKAYKRAKETLSKHRDHLDAIAELLLKKELILKDDIEQIVGHPPVGKVPTAAEVELAKAEKAKAERKPEVPIEKAKEIEARSEQKKIPEPPTDTDAEPERPTGS